MTSASIRRRPAADPSPCATASGMAPTTNPSAATTSDGRTELAMTQPMTPAEITRLDSHSSRHACQPLSRCCPAAPKHICAR